jgi:hypothetical protein
MQERKSNLREPAQTIEIEKLLGACYSQLLKWGVVLTRGDLSKAQDIVQEFCLYFTLTRPDLGEIVNIDGYLYTSLRHIYLSSLARASREATYLITFPRAQLNLGYTDPALSDLLFGQSTMILGQSFGESGSLYQQGGARSIRMSVRMIFFQNGVSAGNKEMHDWQPKRLSPESNCNDPVAVLGRPV